MSRMVPKRDIEEKGQNMSRTAATIILIFGLVHLDAAWAQDRDARLGRLSCVAGQIAKFDGQSWRCADDNDGGGLVLLDANGEEIGVLVDVQVGTSSSPGLVNQVIIATRAFDDPPILLRFTRTQVFGSSFLRILFETPNCTGAAWFEIFTGTLGQVPSNVWIEPAPSVVVSKDGRQVLYAPAGDDPVIRGPSRSELHEEQGCINVDRPLTTVLPAEVVDDDLLLTFPPPYRLEVVE